MLFLGTNGNVETYTKEKMEPTYSSSIEDILPLSPLQEGLLFHALEKGGVEDCYCRQLVIHLEGLVDVGRFETAVRALVVRYGNLRARFVHHGVQRPVQV